MEENTFFKDAILSAIKDLEQEKIKNNIYPVHILVTNELKSKINELVNKALNDLFRENKIEVGKSMNDKFVKTL